MRLKILFLGLFIPLIHILYSQPTVTFSQTRGCIPYVTTVFVKNNGFCNVVAPNIKIFLNGTNASIIPSTDSVLSVPITINSTGFQKLEITCTVGVTATIGSFNFEGLTNANQPFTLNSCQGRNATVNLLNPFYDKYNLIWNDGTSNLVSRNSNTLQQINHTYTDDITKTITVAGFYEYTVAGLGLVTTCGVNNTGSITPYPTLTTPQLFQLTENNIDALNGQVTLDIRTDQRLKYRLSQRTKTGTYTPIDTLLAVTPSPLLSATSSYQVGGLNSVNNTYCFKLESFDDCGNIDLAATPVAINQLCTLPLAGTAALTGNQITIGDYNTFPVEFSLSISGFVSLTSILGSTFNLTYLDQNVECGNIYTYRAKAKTIVPLDSQVSISAPISILAIKTGSTVAPPSRFIATYGKDDERLTLTWNPVTTAGIGYEIFAEGGLAFKPIATFSGVTSFAPNDPFSKCYHIRTKSLCGSSDTVTACPPFLQTEKISNEENAAQWTNGKTGDNEAIVSYDLEFTAQGTGRTIYFVEKNISSPYSHILASKGRVTDTISQVLVYRVIGYLADGTEIRSDFQSVTQDMRVFMPTAFSPNGDGLNDNFVPRGLFFIDEPAGYYNFSVFNRWGQTVFFSDKKGKGWDGGQFNPDLYHYVVNATDQFLNKISLKGTFQLIR